MSNPFSTRLHLEELDDRIVPSASFDSPPAFNGLDVAVGRFAPVDPCRCLAISPVFALNYGTPQPPPILAMNGLSVADVATPNPPPISPVFYGLAGEDDGGDDIIDAGPQAFTGLDVAVERFQPTPPPISESPVFALNYSNPIPPPIHAMNGLSVADVAIPVPPPISPVFYGLAGVDDGGGVDTPA